MNKVTIHVEIGHILVVSYENQLGYFWLDRSNQQGSGPFEHMSTALEHFSYTHRNKLPTVVPNDNLITVDFTHKRRI